MFSWLRKRPPATDGNRSRFLARGEQDFLYSEQFKALRAKFEYKIDRDNQKVVAVTSAVAGEGKTVSCVNLAKNLASAGRKKILLIDMDLRKSDLAQSLEVPLTPGLTEFLSGEVELKQILRTSATDGLYLVTAGSRVSDPADLIAGDRVRSLLNLARAHFDIILLDTPPIIPVADTINLRDKVDGFLLVYRTGFTPHEMLRQAVEEIGEKQVFGVVLNGVEPKKEKYYLRYYGKYYRKPSRPENGP